MLDRRISRGFHVYETELWCHGGRGEEGGGGGGGNMVLISSGEGADDP